MREIKFRLVLNGKIVGYEWHKCPSSVRCAEPFHSPTGGQWINVRAHPEQWIEHNHKDEYTGLKDKNGTEIYEGDIVTGDSNGRLDLIMFACGCFVLRDAVMAYEATYWGDEIEVVGNIHENPELLK